MSRAVHHHEYVSRSYEAICDDLEARGVALVESATAAASTFAADLAGYLEKRLGFFDRDERVEVVMGAVDRTKSRTLVPITWRADATRRLLPNVEAELQVTPILRRGPQATTELTLEGQYAPPRTRHGGLVERALTQRVVDATLHTFLRHLAEALAQKRPAA